jgi:hypothetical protein
VIDVHLRQSTPDPTETAEPARTGVGAWNDFMERLYVNRIGHWASRTISFPQLRKLIRGDIPWAPLGKPLAECKVVLLSTGGVHLQSDPPFNVNGDYTFRAIPKDVEPGELGIAHRAYDRTDALRDINQVFPIERLRELEAERVIGRLADEHYGFGLAPSAKKLVPSLKEVARLVAVADVDLALLVPA